MCSERRRFSGTEPTPPMVAQPLRTTPAEVSSGWTLIWRTNFLHVCLLSNGDELHDDGQRKLHDVAEWKCWGRHRWNNLYSRCQRDWGNRVRSKIFVFLLIESSCFQLHQPWRSPDPSKPLKRRESQWTSAGRGRWRAAPERQEQSHVWDGRGEWRGGNVFKNKKSASSLSVLS